MKHYTVLKSESINGLNLHDSSVIVDGTRYCIAFFMKMT